MTVERMIVEARKINQMLSFYKPELLAKESV